MFDPYAVNYTCGYNPEFLDRVYTQRRAHKRMRQAELEKKRHREREQGRRDRMRLDRQREFNAHVAAYLKYKLLVEEGLEMKQRRLVGDIVLEVAQQHGFRVEEITGASRNAELVRVRHEAMWKARQERPDLSLPQLGRLFGGRDHTTILHGVRRHEERMKASNETP